MRVQPAKVCKTNFSSQTIKTVAKLTESMNNSLGADASYGGFSFSANSEKQPNELLHQQRR